MISFKEEQSYPTGGGPVLVLAAERFLVRTIPLAAEGDVTEQVELAVEACSPLPLVQLYWGYLVTQDRRTAIAWIACRKHFSPEEVSVWSGAGAVLPAVLLLCRPPVARPAIVIHSNGDRCVAAAWEQAVDVPVLVLSRFTQKAGIQAAEPELLHEIKRRTGLDSAQVVRFDGAVSSDLTADRAGLTFGCSDLKATYRWAEMAQADMRDRAELSGIRRRLGYERLLWRASFTAAVLVVTAAVVDLANAVGASWLEGRRSVLAARATIVEEIQATHTLVHRLGELSQQQLKFMEMLDVLNGSRPPGLVFVRAASVGTHVLEISARTSNADGAAQYESALRALPVLRDVRLSNLQAREGQTAFSLVAEFQPEATLFGGAQP